MHLPLPAVRVLTLLLGSALFASAAAPSRLIRRLSLAAVVAAEAMDAYSTHLAVANGAGEANPLLARNGQPIWGRIIGVKIGIVAGVAFAQEFSFRKGAPSHDRLWTLSNSLIVALVIFAAQHNFALADQLKAREAVLKR